MSDIAIHVENLGKLYRIGERQRYKALRDTLSSALYAPFRAAASLFNGHGTTAARRSSNQDFWSLKNVSFDIKKGEAVGIIGRNGAGKSTLLKILSRITRPTEGYVRIHGRVGSLLEVGTGFHPELTGRENTYLNAAIIGMKKKEIDRKFDEIVAFAEIEKFLDTPVKFYSSGMYVRLAFAVAAHLEPEILLVDEVLAVGDAAFQKKCLGKMGDVAEQGRTVLLVSHNMQAMMRLCKRTILLTGGKVGADGPSQEVIPMYLEGSGTDNDKEKALQSSDGRFVIRLDRTLSNLKQIRLLETIPLTAEISSEGRLDNKVFGYQITSTFGQLLATFTTRDVGLELPNEPNIQVTVRCQIPLSPGIYTLNAFLLQDGSGMVIPPTSICTIEITEISAVEGFYYAQGRTGVVISGEWEARPKESGVVSDPKCDAGDKLRQDSLTNQ